MRCKRQEISAGFTLVELLIVICIIALLVAMLLPLASRAKDMAQKAVCSTQIHNLGVANASYFTRYGTYPHYGPWPWMTDRNNKRMMYNGAYDHTLDGWPKLYGMLELQGLIGTKKTDWGNYYYGGLIEQISNAVFCPAMDPYKILDTASAAGGLGFDSNYMMWVGYHPWAIGYQWSPFLKAGTPAGREPPSLMPRDKYQNDTDLYQWIMPNVFIQGPGDNAPVWYCAQAVTPGEIASPAEVAEAWDSWDLESTPNVNFAAQLSPSGGGTPGWSNGPPTKDRIAFFNRWRHKSCPNILYADGHVSADATVPVDPEAYGLFIPNVKPEDQPFLGFQATTWSDNDPYWGSYRHLLPRCEFQPPRP